MIMTGTIVAAAHPADHDKTNNIDNQKDQSKVIYGPYPMTAGLHDVLLRPGVDSFVMHEAVYNITMHVNDTFILYQPYTVGHTPGSPAYHNRLFIPSGLEQIGDFSYIDNGDTQVVTLKAISTGMQQITIQTDDYVNWYNYTVNINVIEEKQPQKQEKKQDKKEK